MHIELTDLPAKLRDSIETAIRKLSSRSTLVPLDTPLVEDDDQGAAPEWYGDPEMFRSVKAVGADFVSEDWRDEGESDLSALQRYLEDESDELYLDVFEISKHPGVLIASVVESRGQWGVWITDVGVAQSMSALEEYLLEKRSLAIAGGKTTLSLEIILTHHRRASR